MDLFYIKTSIEYEFIVQANNSTDALKKLFDEKGTIHKVSSCKRFEFIDRDVYDCKTSDVD